MRTTAALLIITVLAGPVPAAAGDGPAALTSRAPGKARPLADAIARAAHRPPIPAVARETADGGRTPGARVGDAPVARCRRWRRVLVGAGLGVAAAAPLASLVHRRFENEAADGGPAAGWTVGLGALAGSLIANATCDR